MKVSPRRWRGAIHLLPYFVGDSMKAVRTAARRKRRSRRAVDLNWHITKNGVWVATHWPKPLRHGFHDPLGLIDRDADIWDLTWAEVSRLRAGRNGRIRIHRAETILASALVFGVRVEFEVKDSPAAETVAAWRTLFEIPVVGELVRRGLLQVKTLSDLPGAGARLRACEQAAEAAELDVPTILLRRGPVRRLAARFADYIRG